MPRRKTPIALAPLILCLSLPARADDLRLSQPIDCTLGETCHIQHYVDRDPTTAIRDYRCGALSYDGHNGTDFALPTLADMRRGVDVLAAAPGVVRGLRDEMEDREYTDADRLGITGRECGNGVVLRHEGGYETQYCHLKSGSVRVQQGDRVDRGAVLGQVGLSGLTQFPHVHLSVRRDGKTVDPSAPDAHAACGADGPDLWQTTPDYRPGGLLQTGFTDRVPDYAAIRDGTAAQTAIPADASALVLFGFAFGGRKGDVMHFEIDGPGGELLDQELELDKDQARFFRAAGKRLRAATWPPGPYTGRVTLRRDGAVLSSSAITMVIE